ncbi:hypothetical protein J4E80_010488 [Alternaria sp. BMP 0032]|nr:hypothetical protein J4E80_010488 [Alternaria sp. BMP 0032]
MAPATKQTAKANGKPVFKTSSPFSETQWPEITREDEEVILELLSKTYIHPSKGKKRKRNTKANEDGPENTPPSPEIGNHLLVGINSVTRHLEALAAENAPTTAPVSYPESALEGTKENPPTTDCAPGAKTLELYVREHIGLTECKWVGEAMSVEWKGLNVNSEIPGSK